MKDIIRKYEKFKERYRDEETGEIGEDDVCDEIHEFLNSLGRSECYQIMEYLSQKTAINKTQP